MQSRLFHLHSLACRSVSAPGSPGAWSRRRSQSVSDPVVGPKYWPRVSLSRPHLIGPVAIIPPLMGHMPAWLIIKQDRTVVVAAPSCRLMAVSGYMREMRVMHVGNALFQVGVAV